MPPQLLVEHLVRDPLMVQPTLALELLHLVVRPQLVTWRPLMLTQPPQRTRQSDLLWMRQWSKEEPLKLLLWMTLLASETLPALLDQKMRWIHQLEWDSQR